MNNLEGVSTYYLMLELTDDGHTGLLPNLEPIKLSDIVDELERRTGLGFGNSIEDWSTWFLGNEEHGSELERANFLISLKTAEAMSRIWNKVNSK